MSLSSRLGAAAGSVVCLVFVVSSPASAATIFLETFDSVDYSSANSEGRIAGIPTTNLGGFAVQGADNDWYGAYFENPDDGTDPDPVSGDVGAWSLTNPTRSVGYVADDAGILIPINTAGITDVQVEFRWSTFETGSTDAVVFGYFVGDLIQTVSLAPTSIFDAATRSFDLRNAFQGRADGDGPWNWGVQNAGSGSNEGDWVELFRDDSSPSSYITELFDLSAIDNVGEVWLAFWLDDDGPGEGYGKFDFISVTGNVVPLPAALPLLLTGLLGFALVRRRPVFKAD